MEVIPDQTRDWGESKVWTDKFKGQEVDRANSRRVGKETEERTAQKSRFNFWFAAGGGGAMEGGGVEVREVWTK